MTKENGLPPVKVQRASERPKRTGREKCCATCGKPFVLEPEQKFFDCPACYQKKNFSHPPRKTSATGVLSQIQCANCGMVEFVGFVPDNPNTVLCGQCFKVQAREQKKQNKHIRITKGD